MKNILSFLLKILFITSAISIALFSLRYVFLGAEGVEYLNDNDAIIGFLSQQKTNFWNNYVLTQKPLYYKNEFALLAHIIGASVALITGVFQLTPFIKKRSIKTHKILGYLYVVSSIVGLSLGAYISFTLPMIGGLNSIIMNIITGFCGIIFILIALLNLSLRKYHKHGEWMLRSYAVLFTIVTVYFLIGVFALFRVPADIGYELSHLLCLPLNLILIEIIINKKQNSSKLRLNS